MGFPSWLFAPFSWGRLDDGEGILSLWNDFVTLICVSCFAPRWPLPSRTTEASSDSGLSITVFCAACSIG